MFDCIDVVSVGLKKKKDLSAFHEQAEGPI